MNRWRAWPSVSFLLLVTVTMSDSAASLGLDVQFSVFRMIIPTSGLRNGGNS